MPQPVRSTAFRPVDGYDDSTPPPVIHATGTDYVAIVESLERYRVWLLGHHPDSALVHEFEQRGTITYTNDVEHLDRLRNRHQTQIAIGHHVTFTVASVRPALVTFRAHEVITEDRDLDLAGRVVAVHPWAGDNDYVVVMVLGTGNRWRLADVTRVDLDPTVVL